MRDWNGDMTISKADGDNGCTSKGTDAQGQAWVFCPLSGLDQRYTLDVPDTASQVSFTIEFWQDNTRMGAPADAPAPITPGFANVKSDIWTINDNLTVTSGYRVYESGTIATIDGVSYWNKLTVEVQAHGGSRAEMNLVVAADFSGISNVTDSAGNVVSRRYVGEPRFVEVLVNGTSPTYYFVPQSVFFDTAFFRDLQDASTLATSPYTKMQGYQNGTGSKNSDAIQMVYKFDGLMDAERNAVRNALLQNATGVANKRNLTWTGSAWSGRNSPYLVGLPADVIRSVPLVSWYSTPSHPENLSAPRPLRDSNVAGLK